MFRTTTRAAISGLKLLLQQCADLRAELITIVDGNHDGNGSGSFSARQRNQIVELKQAAQAMDVLLASLADENSMSKGGLDVQ